MATSGSFTTNTYDNRGLKFTWTLQSQNIQYNYSVINWSLTGYGGVTSNWIYTKNAYLNIAGTRVFTQSGTIKLYGDTVIASGQMNIYHHNNGSRIFNADAGAGIYANAINVTGSGSWEINKIPRYANITQYDLLPVDETHIKFTWGADSNCDAVQYSINGGSWTVGTYPTTNINGLTANTTYNVKIRIKRQDSQLWTESAVKNVTTYDYPKPLSITDFVIGEGAIVNLYNPFNRNIKLEIISNNDSSVIGTYIGNLSGIINAEFKTDDAVDKQYKSIPNSNTGSYYAKVTYNNISKVLGNKTYTTKLNDCNPIFNNFEYKDSNPATVAVTENERIFVKGHSKLSIIISNSDKMKGQKYASPKNYGVICDNLNKNINYENNNIDNEIGIINSSGNLRINVKAYDSRDNYTVRYKDITILDYIKPTINITAERVNNFENETTLKINGLFTKLDNKNTIKSVKYRFKETNGTWNAWTNVNTSISNNKFNCNNVYLSLDNSKSFNFEVKVEDKIDSNIATINLDVGKAIFFISSNKKQCYINDKQVAVFDDIPNESNIIKKIYPVGSCYITSNNVNPSTFMPGTSWELVRLYKGGELLGVGNILLNMQGNSLTKGTTYSFNNYMLCSHSGRIIKKQNFTPFEILSSENGTFEVKNLNVIGYIKCLFTLSGRSEEGHTGTWFRGESNSLPSGVQLFPNESTQSLSALLTSSQGANYGGTTYHFGYFINTNNTNNRFLINPTFSPYNGDFVPQKGGVKSFLTVEVYSKGENQYIWKRIN